MICLPIDSPPGCPARAQVPLLKSVFLLLLVSVSMNLAVAQNRIAGKVTDDKNNPLTGASVTVKNKSIGTFTDNEGLYSLAVSLNDTLIFSSVGYQMKEVRVTSFNDLNVQMALENSQMEQVVVVGFGRQKLPTVTGSVSVIGGKELVQTPVANVSNMLVGMAPGITGIQNSGEPGQNATMLRIRGIATLNGSNPLVVIDGVQQPAENPFTMLNAIDANDIDNISVLKDASATAVFGIRGANGVIIVTTKRGQSGRPSFSFSMNRGYTNPTSLMPLTNSYDFASSRNESIRTLQASGNNSYDNMLFSDDELWKFQNNRDYTNAEIDAMSHLSAEQKERLRNSPALYYTSHDWYKELFSGTGVQNQYNLNVSGGSSKFRYSSSIGYFDQTGILNYTKVAGANVDPKYSRYTFRNNFDINVVKNLQLSVNISGQFLTNKVANPKSDNFSNVESSNLAARYQAMLQTMGYGPFISPGIVDDRIVLHFAGSDRSFTNPVGTIRGGNGGYPSQVVNPLNLVTRGYGVSQGTNLSTQMTLKHTMDYITSGLSSHFTMAYDDNYSKGYTVTPGVPTYSAYRNPADPEKIIFVGGAVSADNTLTDYLFNANFRKTYYEAGLNYTQNYDRHNVTGLLLGHAQKYVANGLAYGTPSGLMGLVARATYNYDERYLIEGNMGINGTEQFAPEIRFGFFPAVSAGWIISNESFFGNNSWFTFAKIRGSYGEVGNDQIGAIRYLYLPNSWNMSDGGNGYYFGSTNGTTTNPLVSGAYEASLGNPVVTWERANKTNIQLDLRFLDDRLSLSATYFAEKRRNILVQPSIIPESFGVIGVPASNLGEVSNQGWEFELGWDDKIGNDFSYFVKANFSYARNKIDYMAEAPFPHPWMNQTGFMIGQPKGLIADGFYNTQEELANRPLNTFSPLADLGDIRYKDINGDGRIDVNDQVPIGYPTFPLISYNTRIGFSYKNFNLSALFIGTAKGSYDISRTYYGGNRIVEAVNDGRWTQEKYEQGADISYPAMNAITGVSEASKLSSTFWLRSTDFVRLKNLSVSYSFQNIKAFQRAGIKAVNVFANGNNLITWTKLVDGIDPESTSQSSNGYIFPLIKTYNVGVNLSF
ncbi:SusC/RagA family TonB-linked outer membrane protein [Gynurincola endophyticus]|uniref:SusC/RagA family TonB-linked outer membrane protein n=1 Tax=Gynurincola endophyticus TaxID=2479004 RepID=UPI000F8F3B03|nr:TonB-dependent receptor [Gynurincola endophyticus]